MDLFDKTYEADIKRQAPLADRMRPRTLEEFFGQDKAIGRGTVLRRLILQDRVPSMVLYGPPGSGKTTLAKIIANTTKSEFISISAVTSGVGDIKEAVEKARDALKYHNRRTILFIDEVHRFNKAQQDALLPHVENGTVILIGATTENPM
ncbi:MAG: AAA family ATPase, partial [Firmicutes bacterium]|nr:AAA family ATPase [Bacillota bacterium]